MTLRVLLGDGQTVIRAAGCHDLLEVADELVVVGESRHRTSRRRTNRPAELGQSC